jgi:Flp pilus assembly protein TadB
VALTLIRASVEEVRDRPSAALTAAQVLLLVPVYFLFIRAWPPPWAVALFALACAATVIEFVRWRSRRRV